jgi:UDP-glucose 4-epimerase
MGLSLVTGGAGFIGSHLVDALLQQGQTVRVLDNFSTGHRRNLLGVTDRIQLIEGDITDLETVRSAMRDVEVVYHQAALASVPRSVANPIATHRACVDGTLNVLVAAREAGVRRVVYAASSSAYGNSPLLPRREEEPVSPMSPYAAAKLAAEHYCAAFTQVYGLQTVRLRYFNVFGPRQSPESAYAAVIPLFIQAMSAGKSPTVHGDGQQSRDFTYVADVVQANLLAAQAEKASGKVYNVACGHRTSLLELIAILNELLGTQIAPVLGPPRPGDVLHSQASIDKARADLGYNPTTTVRQGLEKCLSWWRQRQRAA